LPRQGAKYSYVTAPYVDPSDDDLKALPRDKRRLGVLWRLTALVRPYRGRFAFAVAMLLAASAITLAYPLAAKQAVDVGMGAATTSDLDWIVLVLLALFAVNAAFVWLRHYSMSWLGAR